MTTLEWLVDQVTFLTKRVYVLETELAKNGIPGPFENASALHKRLNDESIISYQNAERNYSGTPDS